MKVTAAIKSFFNHRLLAPLVAIGLVVISFAFIEVKQNEKRYSTVRLSIDKGDEHLFLDRSELIASVNNETALLNSGLQSEKILRELEDRLEANPYVKEAEVYKNIQGKIRVDVTQRKAIARVLCDNSADAYIAQGGRLMPYNSRYAARVTLITGAFTKKLVQTNDQHTIKGDLLAMLQMIHEDEFLSRQVSQLDIDAHQRIIIYPQVGGQKILFGNAEGYKKKFAKIRIAYAKILPKKGWNKYSVIDVRFGDQVVCR